jgi:SAM-dependent methyltransferase
VCNLIFVPLQQHLSLGAERSRYALHTNSLDDSGYVRYLQEVVSWVQRIRIADPSVLDFGSGENQVLSVLLNKQGIRCTAYDPVYGIGQDALGAKYDIVVVCEVIEHLRILRTEVENIGGLLKPGGFLLLRTEMVSLGVAFNDWWYVQDQTHINFFSKQTVETLSQILSLTIHATDDKRFFLLKKTRQTLL